MQFTTERIGSTQQSPVTEWVQGKAVDSPGMALTAMATLMWLSNRKLAAGSGTPV
jgi:hypothetical protein